MLWVGLSNQGHESGRTEWLCDGRHTEWSVRCRLQTYFPVRPTKALLPNDFSALDDGDSHCSCTTPRDRLLDAFPYKFELQPMTLPLEGRCAGIQLRRREGA